MRWLIALLLMSFPALAETVTTGNVLPNLSTFTKSGSTTSDGSARGCTAGEFCTGDATAGGGTYASTFDVPLTEAEIRRGFTLDTSVTVDSHPSNANLATCSSITQSSDCRDIFNVTVALFDVTNTVVQKFERQVELDFGGLRTFNFTDTVQENSFSVLTGGFELFGVDAGFHSPSFFGPKFSEPSVSFTHDRIVEQQILAQIATVDQQVAIAPPPVDIIAVVPVALPPPPAAPAPIVVAAAPEAPPAPPAIAPIQLDLPAPAAEQQQQEAQAEATIEAQIEQAPEPTPEPAAEPEAPSSPEETTEAAPEAAPEAVQPPQPKTRQQKIKAAAQKVVAKIAPSQRYSAAAQTTMLVAMGMIAPRIKTTNALVDVVTMPTTSMRDDRSLANPMQNYTLFGSSNGAHEALVQLDWKR
jgi:hypothetical protein